MRQSRLGPKIRLCCEANSEKNKANSLDEFGFVFGNL